MESDTETVYASVSVVADDNLTVGDNDEDDVDEDVDEAVEVVVEGEDVDAAAIAEAAAQRECFFVDPANYTPPPLSGKGSQSCRVMSTFNNWTQEVWDGLVTYTPNPDPDKEGEFTPGPKLKGTGLKYMCVSREIGDSGTPHLQPCFFFDSNKRIGALKAIDPHAHWIYPKAKDNRRIINYSKKGDQPHPNWDQENKYKVGENFFGISRPELHIPGTKPSRNWIEWGTPPLNAGKRSDRIAVKEAVTENVIQNKGHCDMYDLLDNHFEPYSHCKPSTDLWVALSEAKVQRELTLVDNDELEWELRPWQKAVLEKILNPKPREIIFVVDTEGNAGKSCFIPRLEHDYPNLPLFECAPGKQADVAYSLKQHFPKPKIIYMDCPRDAVTYIPYKFLEQCKNGKVNSTKYIPGPAPTYGKNGFVGCFMNEFPDIERMSKDRYYVIHIVDKDTEPDIYSKEQGGFPDELFSPTSNGPDEEVYEPRQSKRKRTGTQNGNSEILAQMSQTMTMFMESQAIELEYKRRRRETGNRPTVNRTNNQVPQPLAASERSNIRQSAAEKHTLADAKYPDSGGAKKRAAVASRKRFPSATVAKLPPLSRKTAPPLATITPASQSSNDNSSNNKERNWMRTPADSPDKRPVHPFDLPEDESDIW